jgi:hypothetical protein
VQVDVLEVLVTGEDGGVFNTAADRRETEVGVDKALW